VASKLSNKIQKLTVVYQSL
jgi:hypothetical protein